MSVALFARGAAICCGIAASCVGSVLSPLEVLRGDLDLIRRELPSQASSSSDRDADGTAYPGNRRAGTELDLVIKLTPVNASPLCSFVFSQNLKRHRNLIAILLCVMYCSVQCAARI